MCRDLGRLVGCSGKLSGSLEAFAAVWTLGLPQDDHLFAAAGLVLHVHRLQLRDQPLGPLGGAANKERLTLGPEDDW